MGPFFRIDNNVNLDMVLYVYKHWPAARELITQSAEL